MSIKSKEDKMSKESLYESIFIKIVSPGRTLDFGAMSLISLEERWTYDPENYDDPEDVPEKDRNYFKEDEFYWLVLDDDFDPDAGGEDWEHPQDYISIKLTKDEYDFLCNEFGDWDGVSYGDWTIKTGKPVISEKE